MRGVIILILICFFFSFLPQTSAKTICNIEGNWKLSFKITNTNPYTVFVTIPQEIHFSDRYLGYSRNFLIVNVDGNVTTNQDVKDHYTILNGKVGIWIPPYSTVKISKDGNFSYILDTTDDESYFRVIGPALMDTIKVFDDTQIRSLYNYGVKVSNYRLFVNGKIVKSPDTEVISIVIPAPLVLENYHSFRKIIRRGNADIWVDSFKEYVNKHEEMSSTTNTITIDDTFSAIDDTLVPIIDKDNNLIPIIDNSLIPPIVRGSSNKKPFDVPAMVLTTDDGDLKSIEFSYVMYKY